jgi:protein-tyrosine phosphatase
MSTYTPHRILFICMGNICRSPIAECVFRHKIKQRGVEHLFEADSAGTGGWHAGEPPDQRACSIMTAKGVPVVGRARQITRADFSRFDLLLCMDEDNCERILTMGAPPEKVRLLLECDSQAGCREVPDPYYGGADGFEHVFRLIDSACEALLEELLRENRVGTTDEHG